MHTSLTVKLARLVVAAALLLAACAPGLDGEQEEDGDPAESLFGNAAAALAGGPSQVLYLSGSELLTLLVDESGPHDPAEGNPVARIPSVEAAASPGSTAVAFVEQADEPVLNVMFTDRDRRADVGVGIAPLWSPTGDHLAYLRPKNPEACAPGRCTGPSEVVIADTSTARKTVALPPGDYELKAWVGDHVLVENEALAGKTVALTPEGDRATWDIPATGILAGSPDGEWVLVDAKHARLVRVEDGRPTDERRELPSEASVAFASAAFSHDSSQLAVVIKDASASEVAVFDVDDPEPAPLEGSDGARGRVMWSPDNDAVAFARPSLGGDALEAVFCPLDPQLNCEVLLQWEAGVTILRLQ